MAITLDHTIVPARDKVASAKFFASLFGLTYGGPMGPFAQVQVNDTSRLISMIAANRSRCITTRFM